MSGKDAHANLILHVDRPDEKFYSKAGRVLAGFAVNAEAPKGDLLLALLMLGDPRVEHLQTPEIAASFGVGEKQVEEPRWGLCGKESARDDPGEHARPRGEREAVPPVSRVSAD